MPVYVCVCVCVCACELRIISPDKILFCINTFITIIIILLYFPDLFPQEQWSVVHIHEHSIQWKR